MNNKAVVKFGIGKTISFSLIITFIILLIAELGLRGWAYFFREQYERYDAESETFVLVPGEHRQGFSSIKINSDGFIGEELQAAGPDLFRIVSVGDSCTFGVSDHKSSYPAVLEQTLQDRKLLHSRLEVVNAGVEGHDSIMALRRLRHKVLQLKPDIVTVYIGWNDLMKYDPSGQVSNAGMGAAMRWLDNLWLTKGTRKLVFFYLRPNLNPPLTGKESFRGSFADFVPNVYEQNLREILKDIEESGARAMLITLPTVVHPDITVDQLKDAGVVFPYYQSAYAVGDFLELIDAYNSVIRQVAVDEGIDIVDLAEIFQKFSDPEKYFYDTMHLNKVGRKIVGETIAEYIATHGMLPSTDRTEEQAD